jgi:hypothetical protein
VIIYLLAKGSPHLLVISTFLPNKPLSFNLEKEAAKFRRPLEEKTMKREVALTVAYLHELL